MSITLIIPAKYENDFAGFMAELNNDKSHVVLGDFLNLNIATLSMVAQGIINRDRRLDINDPGQAVGRFASNFIRQCDKGILRFDDKNHLASYIVQYIGFGVKAAHTENVGEHDRHAAHIPEGTENDIPTAIPVEEDWTNELLARTHLILKSVIDMQPPGVKRTILESFFSDKSAREIAEETGKKEGNVYVTKFRAQEDIIAGLEILKEMGIVGDLFIEEVQWLFGVPKSMPYGEPLVISAALLRLISSVENPESYYDPDKLPNLPNGDYWWSEKDLAACLAVNPAKLKQPIKEVKEQLRNEAEGIYQNVAVEKIKKEKIDARMHLSIKSIEPLPPKKTAMAITDPDAVDYSGVSHPAASAANGSGKLSAKSGTRNGKANLLTYLSPKAAALVIKALARTEKIDHGLLERANSGQVKFINTDSQILAARSAARRIS